AFGASLAEEKIRMSARRRALGSSLAKRPPPSSSEDRSLCVAVPDVPTCPPPCCEGRLIPARRHVYPTTSALGVVCAGGYSRASIATAWRSRSRYGSPLT